MGAVIDLASGIVYAPPRSEGKGAGRIDFWPNTTDAIQFTPDSRLVILRGHRQGTSLADVFFYEWRDNQFRLLLRLSIPDMV